MPNPKSVKGWAVVSKRGKIIVASINKTNSWWQCCEAEGERLISVLITPITKKTHRA